MARVRITQPSFRAVVAGIDRSKKIHTWPPLPDRERSSAAGTLSSRHTAKNAMASFCHVLLSDVVVETHLPAYDFSGFLSHQMRWARGVRDARLGGYIGLVSTFGFLWGLLGVLFASGARWAWIVFGIVLVLRILVALAVGRLVLKDRQLIAHLWLLPVRDLVAVGIWIISFWGSTVKWRGDRFKLKNGRLIRIL